MCKPPASAILTFPVWKAFNIVQEQWALTAENNDTLLAHDWLMQRAQYIPTKFKDYKLTNQIALSEFGVHTVCTYYGFSGDVCGQKFTLPQSVAREGDKERLTAY